MINYFTQIFFLPLLFLNEDSHLTARILFIRASAWTCTSYLTLHHPSVMSQMETSSAPNYPDSLPFWLHVPTVFQQISLHVPVFCAHVTGWKHLNENGSQCGAQVTSLPAQAHPTGVAELALQLDIIYHTNLVLTLQFPQFLF